jgi:HEAT repeat protein
LKPLWLEALARPEADLKRQAAEATTRAHRLGMQGLEAIIPRLVEELQAPGAHPVVQRAAVQALIELNARQTGDTVMKISQTCSLDFAQLVEPALAHWDHPAMRPVWLARLSDPQVPRGLLGLAIAAVGELKVVESVPALRRLAADRTRLAEVRLEAARTLGTLQASGLEPDTERLVKQAGENGRVDRLVAAFMLANHRGDTAEAALFQLANAPEAAVAAQAVRRLLQTNRPGSTPCYLNS